MVYTGTNGAVKETPINGTTYNGNANYGLGDLLLSTNYSVVYAGAGSSVTVSNILTPGSYNVSVFSYSGSGSLITYNHQPVSTGFTIKPNPISAQVQVVGPDISVSFSANIGKWYRLQYSDSLSPMNWQNVVPGPVLGTNILMTIVHSGGASAPQRYYRVLQLDPFFALQFRNSSITSLQRDGDTQVTEYMSGGSRLGDAIIRYRQTGDQLADFQNFQLERNRLRDLFNQPGRNAIQGRLPDHQRPVRRPACFRIGFHPGPGHLPLVV